MTLQEYTYVVCDGAKNKTKRYGLKGSEMQMDFVLNYIDESNWIYVVQFSKEEEKSQ